MLSTGVAWCSSAERRDHRSVHDLVPPARADGHPANGDPHHEVHPPHARDWRDLRCVRRARPLVLRRVPDE